MKPLIALWNGLVGLGKPGNDGNLIPGYKEQQEGLEEGGGGEVGLIL